MDNFTPTFHLAEVTEKGNFDITHTGELEVRLLSGAGTREPIRAKSASPFGGKGFGIIGPVTPLTKVIVAEVSIQASDDIDHREWFWFGVVQDFSNVKPHREDVDITKKEDTGTVIDSTAPDANSVYRHSDVVNKVVANTATGHKLELSEKVLRLENDVLFQEDYSMLTTGTGKHIKLDSGIGPGMDRIIISDEKDNFIVIKTGDDGDTPGPDSMNIECGGNMHLTSRRGEIAVTTTKESSSDIKLQNDGTGDIKINCSQGNIYVAAATGDINLAAKGTVKVDAEQDINLDANNNININAGTQMTLTAPRIDLNP